MKITARTFLTFVSMLIALAAQAQDVTIDDIIQKLKDHPFPESYSADIKVDMTSAGMPIDMDGTIAFHRGAMKMAATVMANGQTVATSMVMGSDGIQWIETNMPAMNVKQVMKMDVSVLKEEFHDVPGIEMVGQTGMNFQPTPEMYDTWRESMDLTYEGSKTIEGQDTYVISGTYKDEYLEKLDPNGSMRAAGTLPDKVKLYIAKDTLFMLRTDMESTNGVNGTVTLSNVDFSPEFSESDFVYSPPDDVVPMDLTEMVRQQLRAMRGQTGSEK